MIIDELNLDLDFKNKYKELYTKYGNKMLKIEGISNYQLIPMNQLKEVSEATNVANGSIDSSANVINKDVNTLQNESMKPFWRLLSHNKLYLEMKENFGKKDADKWLEEQISGGLYMHDGVSASFKPYCYSFSLDEVANKGLFFMEQMSAKKPKHLNTWINHVCEFVNYASNQIAGAVAIPDAILYMYYFWKKDIKNGYISKDNSEKYKEQQIQSFIFRLNQPAIRNGVQAAYTNIQILDRPHLEEYFGALEFPDGSLAVDYFDEFINFQEDYLKIATEIRENKFFTFPVQTASLKVDDNFEYEDKKVAKYVVKHNMRFQETNIYNAKEINGISSCCRLVNKSKDLESGQFFTSIGNTSISVGSMKVSTINIARIAYESNGDIKKFYNLLRDKIKLNHKILKTHRGIIESNIEKGMLPIYDEGLIDIKQQFSTNGVNAIYEGVKYLGGISENELGENSYNRLGEKIVDNILDIFREQNKKGKEKYNIAFNTEQTPAEQCAIKLRKKDSLLYDNNVVKSTKIYGNQWIPLDEKTSLGHRINISAEYDQRLDGGGIGHFNLGEPLEDFDKAWDLVKNIAKEGVVYYSLIQKFQYCKNDHTFYGEACPNCGEPTIGNGVKINGYIVKDEYFHDERKEELENRVFY